MNLTTKSAAWHRQVFQNIYFAYLWQNIERRKPILLDLNAFKSAVVHVTTVIRPEQSTPLKALILRHIAVDTRRRAAGELRHARGRGSGKGDNARAAPGPRGDRPPRHPVGRGRKGGGGGTADGAGGGAAQAPPPLAWLCNIRIHRNYTSRNTQA
eukprot:4917627-Pleurochrysis_carterae.AAC.3